MLWTNARCSYVCLFRPAATGTLKNDGQMSCCVSRVGGRDQPRGHRKKRKKRIKKKKKARDKRKKRTGGTSSNRRFFLITSRKRREDEGNSVSPVTRHWTDIIKSFSRSLSSFALCCVRCSGSSYLVSVKVPFSREIKNRKVRKRRRE